MSQWSPEDEINGADDPLALYPSLLALRRFAKLAAALPWFSRLGEPLSDDDKDRIEAFLFALGHDQTLPSLLIDWQEAADAAVSPDVDTLWGETEDQITVSAYGQATELVEEDLLQLALADLSNLVSVPIIEGANTAASRFPIGDDEWVTLAIGAGTQAAITAGLVIAADAGVDHAYMHRFRLFEVGRWPVALTGNTLHIF